MLSGYDRIEPAISRLQTRRSKQSQMIRRQSLAAIGAVRVFQDFILDFPQFAGFTTVCLPRRSLAVQEGWRTFQRLEDCGILRESDRTTCCVRGAEASGRFGNITTDARAVHNPSDRTSRDPFEGR